MPEANHKRAIAVGAGVLLVIAMLIIPALLILSKPLLSTTQTFFTHVGVLGVVIALYFLILWLDRWGGLSKSARPPLRRRDLALCITGIIVGGITNFEGTVTFDSPTLQLVGIGFIMLATWRLARLRREQDKKGQVTPNGV